MIPNPPPIFPRDETLRAVFDHFNNAVMCGVVFAAGAIGQRRSPDLLLFPYIFPRMPDMVMILAVALAVLNILWAAWRLWHSELPRAFSAVLALLLAGFSFRLFEMLASLPLATG